MKRDAIAEAWKALHGAELPKQIKRDRSKGGSVAGERRGKGWVPGYSPKAIYPRSK